MIDLNKQLEAWLNDGIISAEQAEQMRRSALGVPGPVEHETEPERRIPIITEILGYVGAALAVWAVLFLVSEFWTNLSDWAQASLFGALALVLFAGGAALVGSAEPALQRLSGVLWAGCVGSLAGALFIVFDSIAGIRVELSSTLIGAIATAIAAAMLWKQRSVIQHVVLFAAALTTVVSLLTLGPEPELFVYGFVVWAYALIWLLVARAEVLPSPTVGIVLGGIAMLYGAQIAAIEDAAVIGILLGLATAGLFATAGVVFRERLAIIFGGIGIFMFVPQAMFHFLGETFGGMFGLFLSGLIIIALAIWFGRHREAL
ncbi:MAG: hypothetical protein QNJ89_12415 [Acidimicrobiia bacterium]|nr:hypothetical protein [Acidimicrobiia bacterium]